MQSKISVTASLWVLSALVTGAPAAAQCDISQTKCAINNGKCNIQFKNRTSDTGGSDGSSNIDQSSSAQTIVVKARKANGDKAGNKLQIVAGAKKTMNIEKKEHKDFEEIQISSQDFDLVKSVTMPCSDVQDVLNGNGTCKVFHGKKSTESTKTTWMLGYQCDGGNVGGPTDASVR